MSLGSSARTYDLKCHSPIDWFGSERKFGAKPVSVETNKRSYFLNASRFGASSYYSTGNGTLASSNIYMHRAFAPPPIPPNLKRLSNRCAKFSIDHCIVHSSGSSVPTFSAFPSTTAAAPAPTRASLAKKRKEEQEILARSTVSKRLFSEPPFLSRVMKSDSLSLPFAWNAKQCAVEPIDLARVAAALRSVLENKRRVETNDCYSDLSESTSSSSALSSLSSSRSSSSSSRRLLRTPAGSTSADSHMSIDSSNGPENTDLHVDDFMEIMSDGLIDLYVCQALEWALLLFPCFESPSSAAPLEANVRSAGAPCPHGTVDFSALSAVALFVVIKAYHADTHVFADLSASELMHFFENSSKSAAAASATTTSTTTTSAGTTTTTAATTTTTTTTLTRIGNSKGTTVLQEPACVDTSLSRFSVVFELERRLLSLIDYNPFKVLDAYSIVDWNSNYILTTAVPGTDGRSATFGDNSFLDAPFSLEHYGTEALGRLLTSSGIRRCTWARCNEAFYATLVRRRNISLNNSSDSERRSKSSASSASRTKENFYSRAAILARRRYGSAVETPHKNTPTVLNGDEERARSNDDVLVNKNTNRRNNRHKKNNNGNNNNNNGSSKALPDGFTEDFVAKLNLPPCSESRAVFCSSCRNVFFSSATPPFS